MTEYEITIKIYQNDECNAFLDNLIEKIEELGLQLGGSLDTDTGTFSGVIDFPS